MKGSADENAPALLMCLIRCLICRFQHANRRTPRASCMPPTHPACDFRGSAFGRAAACRFTDSSLCVMGSVRPMVLWVNRVLGSFPKRTEGAQSRKNSLSAQAAVATSEWLTIGILINTCISQFILVLGAGAKTVKWSAIPSNLREKHLIKRVFGSDAGAFHF